MPASVIWQGVYKATNIRVIDLANGTPNRLTTEYLQGNAAMGEPIWLPYSQYDANLITLVALALGIIR